MAGVDPALDPFNEGIEGKGKYYPMVVLTNKKLLLDETYADLTINVGGEKIYAHATIVASRCEAILPMPQDEKKKKKKQDVKIKNVHSGAIMQKVLEYLYTGMVDFPKTAAVDLLHLVEASRKLGLKRLEYLCERWLTEHMTIETCFELLKNSTALGDQRSKGFCLKFALENYNEFIANKDGIHILGIDLFQEVVTAFQQRPDTPTIVSPDQAPEDTLLVDFKKMYNTMPFSDITLTVGGQSIKAHKSILAAHSDAFQNYFQSGEIQGISSEAFNGLMRFIYYGDDSIDPLPACELVAFSRKLKLHSLLRICEDKIRNNINSETVLEILAVAYLPAGEGKQDLVAELKNKAFPYLLEHLSEIDLSKIRFMNHIIAFDILTKIQEAWKKGQHNFGYSGAPSSSSSSSSSRKSKKSNNNSSSNNSNNNNNNNNNSFSLGSQRNPSSKPTNNVPAPPPRKVNKTTSALNLPPPVLGNPPARPPRSNSGKINKPSNTNNNNDSNDSEPLTPKRKKTSSKKNSTKLSKKEKEKKKEEEKRKKEEAKRIAREKKEREKMEKKFKGKKKGNNSDPFA